MKHAIGVVSLLLATIPLAFGSGSWAQNPSPPAHARQSTGFPVHGRNARSERGDTKPGSTVRSAERNGAEPVGMTPPVPAPTVGATGGSTPYVK